MAKTYPDRLNGQVAVQDWFNGPQADIHRLTSQVFDVTEDTFAGGAVGNGITNDVPAVQAAVDAADSAGGGIVYLRPLSYKFSTALQLKPGVRLVGSGSSPSAGAVTTLLGTAGQNIVELPASGANVGMGVENLILSGGLNGIYAPAAASYHTYFKARDVHITDPSQSCMEVLSRIEEWDLYKVTLYGGQYGYRYNGARMDKCSFYEVETKNQTKNGWNITTSEFSAACVWFKPVIHLPAEHGFVASPSAGSIRNWVFINPYTEGIGTSGKSAKTTGTITTGTNTLTVASGTGFANGDPIVVRGAGTNGVDLFTTLTSGGGTVNLVLNDNAATSVTSLQVTNASFDEFHFDTPAAASDVLFIGGFLSGSGSNGHVRYSIDARGSGGFWTLIDTSQEAGTPAYDPNRRVQSFGRCDIRQPSNFTNFNMQYSTFASATTAAETIRTLLVSPAGRDLVLALRDSTDNISGTYGNLEVRKNDANKNILLRVNGTSNTVDTRGRFVANGVVGPQTLTANSATPDVSAANTFQTANTGATTITNFTTGAAGQVIKVFCNDANTTVANNATIKTNMGANKLLTQNKVYTFTLFGTVWIENE